MLFQLECSNAPPTTALHRSQLAHEWKFRKWMNHDSRNSSSSRVTSRDNHFIFYFLFLWLHLQPHLIFAEPTLPYYPRPTYPCYAKILKHKLYYSYDLLSLYNFDSAFSQNFKLNYHIIIIIIIIILLLLLLLLTGNIKYIKFSMEFSYVCL